MAKNTKYLSVAETAKLIRKHLKTAFPGQKFYVRSDSYAGGASININWVDGPTGNEVDKVVSLFSSKGYDGMIDLAYYKTHWMLPDGSVQVAHSPGTSGSMGTVPSTDNKKPHPEAIQVSFGSDYIFTSRKLTAELTMHILNKAAAQTGWDMPELEKQTIHLTKAKSIDSLYLKRCCTRLGEQHDRTWRNYLQHSKLDDVRKSESY